MLSPLIEIDFLEAYDFANVYHVHEYLSDKELDKANHFLNLLKNNAPTDGVYKGWEKLSEGTDDTASDAFHFLSSKRILDINEYLSCSARPSSNFDDDLEKAKKHFATIPSLEKRRYALLVNIVPTYKQGRITVVEDLKTSWKGNLEELLHEDHTPVMNYFVKVIDLDTEWHTSSRSANSSHS